MTERSFIIGTDDTCDIQLEDEFISNRHCRVWEDAAGQVWIEDLGSTNGTWIGGGPLAGGTRIWEPTPIGPGVLVHIGRTDIPWTPK